MNFLQYFFDSYFFGFRAKFYVKFVYECLGRKRREREPYAVQESSVALDFSLPLKPSIHFYPSVYVWHVKRKNIAAISFLAHKQTRFCCLFFLGVWRKKSREKQLLISNAFTDPYPTKNSYNRWKEKTKTVLSCPKEVSIFCQYIRSPCSCIYAESEFPLLLLFVRIPPGYFSSERDVGKNHVSKKGRLSFFCVKSLSFLPC